MAGAERKPDVALERELSENGHRFRFFAAVQLLHRLHPHAVPIGRTGPIEQEPVRFRHATSLSFHPGDIESIEIPAQGRALLTSTFLGLFGSASPLATHFSEEVIRAEAEDQHTLRGFYDIFHHRLISLYYRAWKKYRIASGFRRGATDESTKRMLCLVGVDAFGGRATNGLSSLEVLELAPLLAMRSRSGRVLCLALQRLIPGVPIELEPFIERRARIDKQDRMRLGEACNRLSVDYTLGERVLDRSSRFRVVIGPVEYSACEDFMPGGVKYPVLRRVIEQFTRGTLECEVDVRLPAEDVVRYRLGAGRRGGTLGVSTCLGKERTGEERRMRVLLTDRSEDARAALVGVPIRAEQTSV